MIIESVHGTLRRLESFQTSSKETMYWLPEKTSLLARSSASNGEVRIALSRAEQMGLPG